MLLKYCTRSSHLCKLLILLLATITMVNCAKKADKHVNNIKQAQVLLKEKRTQVQKKLEQDISANKLSQLVSLGLWQKARSYLDEVQHSNNALKLVEARLWMKKHRYEEAEKNVREVLKADSENRKARLLRAKLYMQASKLQKAVKIADNLLAEDEHDAEAGLIRGRIALLNRHYNEAREWAQKVQSWNAKHPGAYLLKAEVRFWNQKPAAAESPLVRALELDPFNVEARFNYGYAIWRRVDATQLDDMAAQWNFALEINPLHYLTNWHFGNGHTNLTYADYAQPTDSAVNAQLNEADKLIAQNKTDQAIKITREVGTKYPESVLPAMIRGSIYYMYYDMDRATRLDSAQAIFSSILDRKQNYGPAHNGLAAVAKQQQFTYLDGYDKLEQTISQTDIPKEGSVFYDVFKDANYFPGDRVKKMIAQQIGPSKAYLPMINKFGSDFAIPALHKDLAEAMGSTYFRYGTTFDNRQWMDIRGVGSGATGIEYLERGAHWERNVLAHEYAHLYHGRILTDKESRRIRALYYAAMKNDHTLDYYASNNESEFFAQGYAGFLSEKKVHPLNHKSMNTRKYIREKDPDFYAFLDSLIQRQQQYLSGNKKALADNWAQTYLSLSERSHGRENFKKATAYLDTAMTYSADYIPAILERAEIHAEQGNFEKAENNVAKARKLDKEYGPLYLTQANIIHQKAVQNAVSFNEAMDKQIPLFEKAKAVENDLAVRARLNHIYRQRYSNYGHIPEAIDIAKQYAKDAPTVSTYLEDQKEETQAYAKHLRGSMGYSAEAVDFFEKLVNQNPQNFDYRLMYADILIRADELDNALNILQEGQHILASADEKRSDYALRIARIHTIKGENKKVGEIINRLTVEGLETDEQLLLLEIYVKLNQIETAAKILDQVEEPILPAEKSDFSYGRAVLAEASEKTDKAVKAYQKTLEYNPHHLQARTALFNLLKKQGQDKAAAKLSDEAENLSIPLGPDFESSLERNL